MLILVITYSDTFFMAEGNAKINITKNTLTGSGNTTSFVFSYIHTWEDHYMSPSVSKAGVSFSLNSVKDSWEHNVSLSGFEY